MKPAGIREIWTNSDKSKKAARSILQSLKKNPTKENWLTCFEVLKEITESGDTGLATSFSIDLADLFPAQASFPEGLDDQAKSILKRIVLFTSKGKLERSLLATSDL